MPALLDERQRKDRLGNRRLIRQLKGDGSTLGSMDAAQAAGMDPEICADKIVRAVEAERNEVYIGGKEKLGVYLQRFVPDLFALIIRKAKVR